MSLPKPPSQQEAKSYDANNRDLWDLWTPFHARSKFYNVDRFKAGISTLKPLEGKALGNVDGKSILHLQCHFGLDSLSLARLGAKVTAVDYSGEAIRLARSLARQVGLEARFIEANVFDLPQLLDERFDIVFSSYGVLHWLPDLARWGETIAFFLRSGGFFYMVEFHPQFSMLDSEGLKQVFPYFATGEPVHSVKRGTCMDPDSDLEHLAYEWPHSLEEILMGLLRAGLRLTEFREYPYIFFNCLPHLKDIGEGRYTRTCKYPTPMMFSVRAVKSDSQS